MSNPRQAMRPKEMIQSLLMIGWTEIGIAQFCGVSQATVNRNRHALYGNPRFNLVSGLQELMESPTPINRTKAAEPMPQTTHWEGCEAVHPECRKQEQEPVASLMTNIQSGDQKIVWNDDGFDRALWHETPLYTAPTPRKPLTDDELEPLLDAVPFYDIGNKDLINFARAIERAHGIGEQT